MKSWDEIAKGAFLTLSLCCENYVNTNRSCTGCCFYTKSTGCIFGNGELPHMWELPIKEELDNEHV